MEIFCGCRDFVFPSGIFYWYKLHAATIGGGTLVELRFFG